MGVPMMVRVVKESHKLARIITIGSIVRVAGIYWWYWQAPSRVVRKFLRALEAGDIQTIYNLTPKRYEQQLCGLTPELIEKTYQKILKPLLSEYRLVKVHRASRSSPIPEIWLRSHEVPFWLWFRNRQGKTLFTGVHAVWYRDEGWRVPWGIFVWKLLIAAYGREQADVLMIGLGYDLIHTSAPGDVLSVKTDLSLLRAGRIKTYRR